MNPNERQLSHRVPLPWLLLGAAALPTAYWLPLRTLFDLNFVLEPGDLLPGAIAYIILLASLRPGVQIRINSPLLCISLLLFTSLLAGGKTTSALPWWNREDTPPAWLCLTAFITAGLAIVTGSLALVNPFRCYKENREAFFYCFLASVSRWGYDFSRKILWKLLAGLYVPALIAPLRIMGFDVSRGAFPHEILHPAFHVRIQSPCSGLEGVFFFFAVFSALMIADARRFRLQDQIKALGGGIALMLGLNYLRLLVFLAVAYTIAGPQNAAEGKAYFLHLFHSNLGWIIYAAGILIWVMQFYRCQVRKEELRSCGGQNNSVPKKQHP